jgi:hypothetical protein
MRAGLGAQRSGVRGFCSVLGIGGVLQDAEREHHLRNRAKVIRRRRLVHGAFRGQRARPEDLEHETPRSGASVPFDVQRPCRSAGAALRPGLSGVWHPLRVEAAWAQVPQPLASRLLPQPSAATRVLATPGQGRTGSTQDRHRPYEQVEDGFALRSLIPRIMSGRWQPPARSQAPAR